MEYAWFATRLHYATLQKNLIENDHPNKTDMCKMKSLTAWLQQKDKVSQKGVSSWPVLQAALRRVGEKKLASRIVVSCE